MSSTYASGLFVPATDYSGVRSVSVGRPGSATRQKQAVQQQAGFVPPQQQQQPQPDASASIRSRSASAPRAGGPTEPGALYGSGGLGSPSSAAGGVAAVAHSQSRLSGASQSHLFVKSPGLAAAAAVYGQSGSSRPQSAGAVSSSSSASKRSTTTPSSTSGRGEDAQTSANAAAAAAAQQKARQQIQQAQAQGGWGGVSSLGSPSFGGGAGGFQARPSSAGLMMGGSAPGAVVRQGGGANNTASTGRREEGGGGDPVNFVTGGGGGQQQYAGLTGHPQYPAQAYATQTHVQAQAQAHLQAMGGYPIWHGGVSGTWQHGSGSPGGVGAPPNPGQGRPSSAGTTRPLGSLMTAALQGAGPAAQGRGTWVTGSEPSANTGGGGTAAYPMGMGSGAGGGAGGVLRSGPVIATAGALGPAAAAMFQQQTGQQQQRSGATTGVLATMPAQQAGTYVTYTSSSASSGSAGSSGLGSTSGRTSTVSQAGTGNPTASHTPSPVQPQSYGWVQQGGGGARVGGGSTAGTPMTGVGVSGGAYKPTGAPSTVMQQPVGVQLVGIARPLSGDGGGGAPMRSPVSRPASASSERGGQGGGAYGTQLPGVQVAPLTAARGVTPSPAAVPGAQAAAPAVQRPSSATPGYSDRYQAQQQAAALRGGGGSGQAGSGGYPALKPSGQDDEDGDDGPLSTPAHHHGMAISVPPQAASPVLDQPPLDGDGDDEHPGRTSPSPYEQAVTPAHGGRAGARPMSAGSSSHAAYYMSSAPTIGPGVIPSTAGLLAGPLNLPQPVMPDFSHLSPEDADAARKAWQRQVQREREWVARQRLKQIVAHPDFDGRATTEFYGFGKVLGQGSFGEVRLAWHRLAGAKVAIKSYEKAKLTEPNHWRRVQQEIRLMERLNHPNIIRELEMIDSLKRIHIVMEYAGGGNLCTYVKSKSKLGEAEARKHFLQLLAAVEYMHDLGIIHRDIKLENVLFDEEQNVKLTDFGFSVAVRDPSKRLKIFCGTPSYMAPEITQRKEYLGRPVDVWSLAVLLYAMLAGHFPFTAKTYPELYKKIAAAQLKFPDHMSSAVRDLLRRMLHPDPVKRLTLAHARMHPWVAPSISVILPPPGQPGDKSLLISDEPSRDVNEAVMQRGEHLGFKRQKVVEAVLSRAKNAASTAYYLLLARMGRSAKVGVQDGKAVLGAAAPGSSVAASTAQSVPVNLPAARPSTAQPRAAAGTLLSAAHARAVTVAQIGQPTFVSQMQAPVRQDSSGSASARSATGGLGAGVTSRTGSTGGSDVLVGAGSSAASARMAHGSSFADASGKLDDGSRASTGVSSRGGSIGPQAGVPPSSYDDQSSSRVGSAFGRYGRSDGVGGGAGSVEGKQGDKGDTGVPRSRSAGPTVPAAIRPRSAAPGLGRSTGAGGGGELAGFAPMQFNTYAESGGSGSAAAAATAQRTHAGGQAPGGAAGPNLGSLGRPLLMGMGSPPPAKGPVRATAAALPQGM